MVVDLWNWLLQSGWTPSELAEELGLSRVEVSRFIANDGPDEGRSKLMHWALIGLAYDKGRSALSVSVRKPTHPLAPELEDDSWAGQTARLILPILIEAATETRETITYGKLHEEVVRRGGRKDVGRLTKYAFPCGRVASAMQRAADLLGDNVPPLTALVVRADTGLPSGGIDGFIRTYLPFSERSGLGEATQRRQVLETVWRNIYSYNRWPEVQSALGITGVPTIDL